MFIYSKLYDSTVIQHKHFARTFLSNFQKYSVSAWVPWQDLDYKPKRQELLDPRMSACQSPNFLWFDVNLLFPRCQSFATGWLCFQHPGLVVFQLIWVFQVGAPEPVFFLCKNMIMFQKVDWTQQLLWLLRSMVGLCDFQHCGTGTERAALPS